MRRDIGYILAGLGTFLIVLAVVLPTFIAPSVIKWPLNQYLPTVLRATNASYVNPQTLQNVTGATVEAHYTFKGDAAKGNSSTAVWDEYNVVQDVTNNFTIQYGLRTFAFDRKSAELVNCCGANVNGDKNVRQTGIAGYAFPIGTQKTTYQVYDATDNKAEPFVYSGTATVHGIQTYMFKEDVAGATAVGEPVATNYENHVVYYIDPLTGIPLDIHEHEILTAQTGGATLFDANLAMTPSTVSTLVSTDNSSRLKLFMLRIILPAAAGILGVVLLVVGALMTRRGKRGVFEPAPARPGVPWEAATAQQAAQPPAPASGDRVQGPAPVSGGKVQGTEGTASSNGKAPDTVTDLPKADSEAKPRPE